MEKRSAIVIGSGFAGLSAASFLAREGWKVTVLEKNEGPGGRAGQLRAGGFSFDKGPSFYWMPDIFERYFSRFGKKVTDYYSIQRLDPSYRVYWQDDQMDLPADFNSLLRLFDSIEAGSGASLEKYLQGAAYKYKVGMNRLVYKPARSLTEFLDWRTISGIFRLQVFTSIEKHIARYFKHPKLRQLMEFPVLFLGALPSETPALYSLMNYADIRGGSWYPRGGIYAVVQAMHRLATELGVEFHFEEEVCELNVNHGRVRSVITPRNIYAADAVVSAADYAFTESRLLPAAYRSYSDRYWNSRVMAPSCLLYFVGLKKKLKNAVHHSLFFDVPFEKHGEEIYRHPGWPSDPLFYASIPSLTEPGCAPEGAEALVLLIPVASGLQGDTEKLREEYFERIVSRMEKRLGESIKEYIIYKKTYSVSDFALDYNSFRGNAYGLANTLRQTAIFRPSCRSSRVKNLFYAGQLTVPGPGVPPCLISGEVAAKQLMKRMA